MYVNSPLPEDHRDVYMRVDRDLSAIECKTDPGFSKHIRDDGSSIVRLKMVLYGCVRVAWYGTIR